MSKNAQQNRSEVFLGNETYARGFNDGLNGRPKTIKKTHRHAHRYHIGYKAGLAEKQTTMRAALSVDMDGIQTNNYERGQSLGDYRSPVNELIDGFEKPSFWQRAKRWLFG